MIKALTLTLFLVSTLALFADDSAVFKLTANNFKSSVLESDEFWLVEFYGKRVTTQLPGVDTARGLLLSTKKLPKFWTEL